VEVPAAPLKGFEGVNRPALEGRAGIETVHEAPPWGVDRQKTGRGQIVDGSLLATGMMFMQSLLAERYVLDIVRQQQGNTGYTAAPSDCYKTKDGWVIVAVIGQPMFKRWARLVGRADLIDDPRCVDDLARGNNAELINAAMDAWISKLTTEEAIQQLEAARVPCGKVFQLGEVFGDPQVQARKLFQFLDYPGSPKPVPIASTPVQLSETPRQIRHRAPLLGEHTDQVLMELGFGKEELANFRQAGVI
jgi:crotonobetainyl-CoA:carnitine CoA-transferase CaiB-like acyl-CoA transferase